MEQRWKDASTRLNEQTSLAQHSKNLLDEKTSQAAHFGNLLDEKTSEAAHYKNLLGEKTSEAGHFKNLFEESRNRWASTERVLTAKSAEVDDLRFIAQHAATPNSLDPHILPICPIPVHVVIGICFQDQPGAFRRIQRHFCPLRIAIFHFFQGVQKS
jgi:hypothetical protein